MAEIQNFENSKRKEMINKNQHDFFLDLDKLLDKNLDQESVTEIIGNFLVKLYKGSLKTRLKRH